jgi:cyclohexanecarboxylate-CoA ligase
LTQPNELRSYLSDEGMTDWYLSTRLEYFEALPRNDIGKLRKELLRRWLASEDAIPKTGRTASAWYNS